MENLQCGKFVKLCNRDLYDEEKIESEQIIKYSITSWWVCKKVKWKEETKNYEQRQDITHSNSISRKY